MSVALYLDANVSYAVAVGLRLRGVDLLTAQEDQSTELTDPKLLTRASKLRRVLFTQDDDLLREATRRQAEHEEFAGLVYAHQLSITIGQCVNDLELIARASDRVGEPQWVPTPRMKQRSSDSERPGGITSP